MNSRINPAIVVLGICIIISSWVFGHYVYKARASEQYVTVKGLSEKEVRADRASWTLGGSYGAVSTQEAQSYITTHTRAVEEFLLANGFDKSEIAVSSINVMRNTYQQAADPYNVQVMVTVETDKVAEVEAAAGKITDLIAKGVTLSGDRWTAGPRYFYTDFQGIKTEMLAEATQNAKLSAEEFAVNSGSQVGKIKTANQGVFQLLPGSRNNDQEEFYADKVVRVVTTVQYFLK